MSLMDTLRDPARMIGVHSWLALLWLVLTIGALVRALGGAGLDYLRRSVADQEPEAPAVDAALVKALADELEARLRAGGGAG